MSATPKTVSHGWKYRIYPTKEQQLRFELAFAATDYVYDQLLWIANRHYKRHARKFDQAIERIRRTRKLDADGNPIVSKKTGKPIYRIRPDSELSADELACITALKAKRSYLNLRKLKFVKRLVPITLDRNGDPWLSYVTTCADGSPLPDWLLTRRLTKVPSVAQRDPNGIRMLSVSSGALNDAVNRLNTAFSNFWKGGGRVGHPVFAVSPKERRNIASRLLEADPGLGTVTDREIYEEAAKSGKHSFSFQVQRNSSKPDVHDLFENASMKRISLPGIPETVKIRTHREPSGLCTHATISREPDGKWFLSLACTDIVPDTVPAPSRKEAACEIGIAHFLVLSDGTQLAHPAQLKTIQKRIDDEKRKLSRKQGGHVVPVLDANGDPVRYKTGKKAGQVRTRVPARSKGYWRQKAVIDRLEAKQRRIRVYNMHAITDWLTRTYETLYIRKNEVADMLLNETTVRRAFEEMAEHDPSVTVPDRETLRDFERNLHRALADSSFFEFRRQLEYKAEWRERDVVVADSDVPTTQACSECGEINPALAGIPGLSIREWDCPHCGVHHDREENSAANILAWAHGAPVGGKTAVA